MAEFLSATGGCLGFLEEKNQVAYHFQNVKIYKIKGIEIGGETQTSNIINSRNPGHPCQT
jgi:hypothetical protein